MSNEHTDTWLAVSVVIPVFNEELSLEPLRDELFPVLKSLGETFEVIFVDDGSTDRSPEILRRFFEQDTYVRVVRFGRNFGQQWAIIAGMQQACGESVIVMDADLQQPAEYIPQFLAKLREGYDLVYGRRARRTGPLYRRIGTRVTNFLLRRLTSVQMGDLASNFFALNRRLVEQVGLYNDRSRFLKSLLAWLSYGRCCEIKVVNRERRFGVTKYGFWQLVRIFLGVIVSLSVRPLALTTYAGMALIAVSALLALRWVFHLAQSGWTASELALFTALALFAGGIQLLALGVLGEYIGRIYGEVRERPPYVITEVLGAAERPKP